MCEAGQAQGSVGHATIDFSVYLAPLARTGWTKGGGDQSELFLRQLPIHFCCEANGQTFAQADIRKTEARRVRI